MIKSIKITVDGTKVITHAFVPPKDIADAWEVADLSLDGGVATAADPRYTIDGGNSTEPLPKDTDVLIDCGVSA